MKIFLKFLSKCIKAANEFEKNIQNVSDIVDYEYKTVYIKEFNWHGFNDGQLINLIESYSNLQAIDGWEFAGTYYPKKAFLFKRKKKKCQKK